MGDKGPPGIRTNEFVNNTEHNTKRQKGEKGVMGDTGLRGRQGESGTPGYSVSKLIFVLIYFVRLNQFFQLKIYNIITYLNFIFTLQN